MDEPKQQLARLLDPKQLDNDQGFRGRTTISVPKTWLSQTTQITLQIPQKLRCDRCDGGGCDPCLRRGVVITSLDPISTLVLTLPVTSEKQFAVRVASPFGPGNISQLVVYVTIADKPSSNVTLANPLVNKRTTFTRSSWRLGIIALGLAMATFGTYVIVHYTR